MVSRRGRPRIDASWTRSGWDVQTVPVPGAYRMLAIWAASGVSVPVTIHVLDGALGLHVAMYVALAVSVAGLLTGAVVYVRAGADLMLEGDPWHTPTPDGTGLPPDIDDGVDGPVCVDGPVVDPGRDVLDLGGVR